MKDNDKKPKSGTRLMSIGALRGFHPLSGMLAEMEY